MRPSVNKRAIQGPDTDESRRAYRRLLAERFPHIQRVALRLLERDETFRELIEEYEACTEAAERLEQGQADDAMRKEYAALRLRLESELLRYLQVHPRD